MTAWALSRIHEAGHSLIGLSPLSLALSVLREE